MKTAYMPIKNGKDLDLEAGQSVSGRNGADIKETKPGQTEGKQEKMD